MSILSKPKDALQPSPSKVTRFFLILLKALQRWYPLFLISSLSLYLELAVIRWISGEVRLFAYFKNLPLLAAFLGLALGFFLVGKSRDYRNAFPYLLGLFIALVLIFNIATRDKPLIYPGTDDFFMWYPGIGPYWLSLLIFLGMVIVFFVTILLLFIPLGQAVGEEMALHKPVPAYITNISASLAGIWVFALLSYWRTGPFVWFGLGMLGIILYHFYRRRLKILEIIVYSIISIGLLITGKQALWSPYNRLDLSEFLITRPSDGETIHIGYNLNVQQVFYQYGINLSENFIADIDVEELHNIAYSYNLPYQFVPEGSKALVLGAGMGNDVAAALRNQMGEITAVDIDPAIIELGKQYHPEMPYDHPQVSTIVDDARSYLNTAEEKFDIIVFGLLDSHTLLSSMSSVRLDSFVYTIESFEKVRENLNDGGIVALTFATGDTWLGERLGRMLLEVFGEDKVAYFQNSWGTTFIAGRTTDDQMKAFGINTWQPSAEYSQLPLSTDDWPYLYMREKIIPAAYWQALLLIGIVCFFLIFRTFPEALHPNWHFWLLGAAFLLIEFKSITELALLFGTTWFVNTLAISGVLVMALTANLIVLRSAKINIRVSYGLLFASLLLSFFFPLDLLAGLTLFWKGIISTLILSVPLFFAGLIFSESLRRAGETAKPLASNFSGSAAAGILEYGSLLWGVKSLYVIAIILYMGALAAFTKRR